MDFGVGRCCMSRSAAREIYLLQYGRGVAAFLVCLYHYQDMVEKNFGRLPFGHLFAGGHSGVEFFFVLSGFIIFVAHERDFGRPEALKSFAVKRAVRILPMFWLAVIPLGLLFLRLPTMGENRELTWSKWLQDVFLIPRSGLLTLSPAWTLEHEVIFYAVFALLLLNVRIGIAALAIWQAACAVVVIFKLTPTDYLLPVNKLVGFHNFGFIFGILAAVCRRQKWFGSMAGIMRATAVIATGVVVALFVGEWWEGPDTVLGGDPALSIAYMLCYTAIILGLVSVPNRSLPVIGPSLATIGASSYVLYLLHEPVASVAVKLLSGQRTPPFLGAAAVVYMALVAAGLAASVAIHFFVEKPVIDWLRRKSHQLVDRTQTA